MSTQISSAAQTARESARTSDGRFGPSATPEAGSVEITGQTGHGTGPSPAESAAASALDAAADAEEAAKQERTGQALLAAAHAARRSGAATMSVEFVAEAHVEGADVELTDGDGNLVRVDDEARDRITDHLGHLDDRRPSLLAGHVRDRDGDPDMQVDRHVGEVEFADFDVDDVIARAGQPR